MPLPFEFVIDGPPVSRQGSSRSRNRWTNEVRRVAREHWGPESPYTGEVNVTITNYFYGSAADVDNVAKPLLDALKGVVYADDSQVSDLLSRKRDRNRELHIPRPSHLLQERLGLTGQFLHIFVDSGGLNQEVVN